METSKPFTTGFLTLFLMVVIPTVASAAPLKVIGSVSLADTQGEFVILDQERGSATVSCGAFNNGKSFEIEIAPLRQDEYDAGSVIHIARNFKSEKECLQFKAKLLAATPQHPISLSVSHAALENNPS